MSSKTVLFLKDNFLHVKGGSGVNSIRSDTIICILSVTISQKNNQYFVLKTSTTCFFIKHWMNITHRQYVNITVHQKWVSFTNIFSPQRVKLFECTKDLILAKAKYISRAVFVPGSLLLGTFRSEYEYDFQLSNQSHPQNSCFFPLFTSR